MNECEVDGVTRYLAPKLAQQDAGFQTLIETAVPKDRTETARSRKCLKC